MRILKNTLLAGLMLLFSVFFIIIIIKIIGGDY